MEKWKAVSCLMVSLGIPKFMKRPDVSTVVGLGVMFNLN